MSDVDLEDVWSKLLLGQVIAINKAISRFEKPA